MDVNNSLVSSGITVSLYVIYKVVKRYTVKSECHKETNTIEIVIKDNEIDKEEEKKEDNKENK